MRLLFGAGLLLAAACASAPAPSPEAVVEQFMWDYTKAWNAHDPITIAEDFYRTGPSVYDQAFSLNTTFVELEDQGYDRSDIHEIKVCIADAETAWAGMKFTRLKIDGSFMPPKHRASSYTLKKFADGWRITKVGAGGVSADQPLVCPAG